MIPLFRSRHHPGLTYFHLHSAFCILQPAACSLQADISRPHMLFCPIINSSSLPGPLSSAHHQSLPTLPATVVLVVGQEPTDHSPLTTCAPIQHLYNNYCDFDRDSDDPEKLVLMSVCVQCASCAVTSSHLLFATAGEPLLD